MKSFSFLDAHTHVQFAAYDGDRDAVVDRALKNGVRFVNIGTQRDTSENAIALAGKHDGVYATVGLHPTHTTRSYHDIDELGGGEMKKTLVSEGEEFDYEYYKKMAQHPKVVAIGECGLDYFHFNECEPRETQIQKQKDVFVAHMKLASEVGKPLMIHCREAIPDLISIFHEQRSLSTCNVDNPGIMHFFSGTIDEAKELLELGFSFTFAGVITFPPPKGKTIGNYDELIRFLPLDRILSETDAPYVAPVPYRGKRNEPAYVIEVVKKLAQLKNISTEEMADNIAKNAKRVLGI